MSDSAAAVGLDANAFCKACAYGDLAAAELAFKKHPEAVNKADSQGFYPLQWAALNNQVEAVKLLLLWGAAIDNKDGKGQTCLHWAVVRGAIACLEVLLRSGAALEAVDSRGYTVCHVAAQYGQTAALYALAVRWGANVDLADYDGRTPLHWAAYNGHADAVRLLIVLDCCISAKDCEGCSALHWAAIKGHEEACKVFLQAGAGYLLSHTDVTGKTVAQLARTKGHQVLGLMLAKEQAKYARKLKRRQSAILRSLEVVKLMPLTWSLILVMLITFITNVWVNTRLPKVEGGLLLLCWTGFASLTVSVYFFYKTSATNPGFLPTAAAQNCHAASSLLRGTNAMYAHLDCATLAAGNWGQMCVTCKIVRPLRAKHDAFTDRCIELFDHYCPWVGNAIGKGNRHHFLVFLWLVTIALATGELVAWLRIRDVTGMAQRARIGSSARVSGFDLVGIISWMVAAAFVLVPVTLLTLQQTRHVCNNITTNEIMNRARYTYLHGAEPGQYRNPFNKGCVRNCYEACWPDRQPPAPYMLLPDAAP